MTPYSQPWLHTHTHHAATMRHVVFCTLLGRKPVSHNRDLPSFERRSKHDRDVADNRLQAHNHDARSHLSVLARLATAIL